MSYPVRTHFKLLCVESSYFLQRSALPLISTWLRNAAQKDKVTVAFGSNNWEKCHGGGTASPPHCRPFGLFNPGTGKYYVRLVACDMKARSFKEVFTGLEVTPSVSGKEPTVADVYNALQNKVDELS